MSAPQLSEKVRKMIMAEIKAKIATALAEVRTDRDDKLVTTEPPRSYFIFDGAHTYQCPAVFVVVDDIDTDEEKGPNHVNAKVSMYVSVVIEDTEADRLTIKSERYQAALFQVLHWITLQDDAKNVKIWSRIRRCTFSPVYTKKRMGSGETTGEFRKEVVLDLEVKLFENPT